MPQGIIMLLRNDISIKGNEKQLNLGYIGWFISIQTYFKNTHWGKTKRGTNFNKSVTCAQNK